MLIASLVMSGVVALLGTRGFVASIRREPGVRPSSLEWVLSSGVGVLGGAMVFSVLRALFLH
jgi:hypothetical protein